MTRSGAQPSDWPRILPHRRLPSRPDARCLYCGWDGLASLYAVADHYGVAAGTFRFWRCLACGSAVLRPLPDAAVLGHAYPASYTYKLDGAPSRGLARLLRAPERVFYRHLYGQRLRAIRRLTGLTRGRVLEIGCGSGHFLALLARAGFDVEGLDVSADDVRYARERLGLSVHHGDVDALELPAGAYDAVILHAVLEHVLDPRATLARVRRLLRPRGVAVVGVPLVDSLQARWLAARWNQATEAPRHVTLPSSAGMRRLLAASGFVDVAAAPTALLDNAGCVALSLLPGAATPLAYGRGTSLARTLARCGGAALLAPALALAALERSPFGRGVTGTMIFAGRRPEDGR